ncbi:anti-sigma factor domain-containing protein [Metabacillus niabensis]|uniref:DNA polymerase III gamma/tau subunit n=1 Tax=Metabacillus niabensis TaxID=324854 RepID=A0ABT9YUT9_9BACI|nr:anti-sigma factor domain-containing protein [Metabacillus niabensis]MDQ0223697.1 DNA polymerase III gamma/tau subunit [Metabacillus niabensis]
MKKGVVVELNDDFVTLLTPDGQFVNTVNKNGQYELGEEIAFFPALDESEQAVTRANYIKSKKRNIMSYFDSKRAKIGTLSLIAIMVIIFTSIPFIQNDKVYAYMSIDINPSFEVSIDDKLRVISLDPLNEDAEQLMKKLPEWKEKQFDEIVDAILTQSKLDGYVYPGKEILITTVINENDTELHSKLEENIEEIQSSYEEKEMNVETIETDRETREKAQQQGISMGKYVQLKEKEKLEPKTEDNQAETTTNDEAESIEKKETSKEQMPTTVTPNVETNENVIQSNQTVKNQLENETKKDLNEVKNDKLQNETKEKLNEAKKKLKENNSNSSNKDKVQPKQQPQAKPQQKQDNWKEEKKQNKEQQKSIREDNKKEKQQEKQQWKENKKSENNKIKEQKHEKS